MLMVEWSSEQFSFYNNRIQDLQDDFNDATSTEEQNAVLDQLVNVVDDFINIGKEDIAELQSADDTRIKALSRRVGLQISPTASATRAKNRLLSRYHNNIETLERIKGSIVARDWSDLRQYAGSMRQMAFPGGIPTQDAPFKVLMGFLTNMQLVGHGLRVLHRKKPWEGTEKNTCPICESELCRCCPDCEQPECVCEQNAADRVKMISDFVPEDL